MSEDFVIPIAEIYVDESFNTRRAFTPESVQSLADKIQRFGWVNPIQVRPMSEMSNPVPGFKWHLRSGHRRIEACKLLGHINIPAVVETGVSYDTAKALNFLENFERKNYTILEEAEAIRAMYPTSHTILDIANDLGVSANWVSLRMRLLNLPEWIQQRIDVGDFTAKDLEALVRADDPNKLAKKILSAKTEGTVRRLHKERPTKDEVRKVMRGLLDDGFSPHLSRLFAWTIGDVGQEQLEESLTWLNDKRAWLRR
jgi:ParB family chromosome partitioning protein